MNRASDERGYPFFMPIRYADDFIILVVDGDSDAEKAQAIAEQEKAALAAMLRDRNGTDALAGEDARHSGDRDPAVPGSPS